MRKRTNFKGIVTAMSHAVVEVVVLAAHEGYTLGARVGRSLDPRHLALRAQAIGRTLAAEAEIASRR